MPTRPFYYTQLSGGTAPGGGGTPAILGHLTGYDTGVSPPTAEGIFGTGKTGFGIPITGFVMVSGPGNVRNLRALATTNGLAVATTVAFAIGAAPTALSLVIPPGVTTLVGPIAGPVAVSDGDLISFKVDSPGAVGGILTVSVSAEFGP